MNQNTVTAKTSRRNLLKGLSLSGLGIAAGGLFQSQASAAAGPFFRPKPSVPTAPNQDPKILNFALNLEYLEAEYYTYATTGAGIAALGVRVGGTGVKGDVTIKANSQVPFASQAVRQYALEIAADERAHVTAIRSLLIANGRRPAARPAIDLRDSFTVAARAAGLIGPDETFDPFADDLSFLLGAFLFEDVGVTAYRGAAPSIANKTVLSAAAGILGTEAYHAATIRTLLFQVGGATFEAVQKISDLRDALDEDGDRDQGVLTDGLANIVPTNAAGLVYARSVRQVLNIVYAAPGADRGGFFPNGINR